MIYIIPNTYEPNTAATNRMLALLGGLSSKLDKGERCEVEFFLPNSKRDKIELSFPNVDIKDWWEHPCFFKNKYLKYISFSIAVKTFIRRLKANDKVLFLGHSELLPWFQRKKGVRLYHEMNECPELFRFGNGPYLIKIDEYIKCCQRLNGLFVISHQLIDYFVEKGVDKNKVHLYRMIVDPNRFEGIKRTNGIEPYIGYCGVPTNFKDGVDVLLQAISILEKNYNQDIKLHIYGKTPSEAEKRSNYELIKSLGIEDVIVYKGVVPAEKMPQCLTDAKVVVLARPENVQSKYGFPTKLGEYLLSGNPVVVTAVGDIPIYLQDGVNALLATPDNPQSIADKIQWALTHEKEAREIGSKGRDVALKFFNPIIEAEHILNIINA